MLFSKGKKVSTHLMIQASSSLGFTFLVINILEMLWTREGGRVEWGEREGHGGRREGGNF